MTHPYRYDTFLAGRSSSILIEYQDQYHSVTGGIKPVMTGLRLGNAEGDSYRFDDTLTLIDSHNIVTGQPIDGRPALAILNATLHDIVQLNDAQTTPQKRFSQEADQLVSAACAMLDMRSSALKSVVVKNACDQRGM